MGVGGKNLLNWRRRYFYLQENGSLHLGCIVSEKGVDKTTRKILPKVELEPVDENRKERLILSMKEYDLAFSCEQSRDFYEGTVPDELYPFAVEWTDKKGKKRRMVL